MNHSLRSDAQYVHQPGNRDHQSWAEQPGVRRPLDFERVEYQKHEGNELRFAIAFYLADGSEEYWDRSTWDVSYEKYTPCSIEREFAWKLRGRQAGEQLPLLHLDAARLEQQAADWIAEPQWISDALQELDSVLQGLTLRHFGGDRRLADINKLVSEATRLARCDACMERAKKRWLKAVSRVVGTGTGAPVPEKVMELAS